MTTSTTTATTTNTTTFKRNAHGPHDGRGREVFRAAPVAEAPPGWNTGFGRGKLPLPEPVTLFQTRIGVMLFWLSLFLFAGLAFLTWRR